MGKKRAPHKGLRRKRSSFRVYDPHYFTPAGPVTIRRVDGSEEVQEPLGPRELQKVVRVRGHVTEGQKQKIIKRDKGCCRYCGCSVGPFHIDHVVPIVSGGSNALKNLVLACDTCNQRKGAQVWTPRPVPRGTPKEMDKVIRVQSEPIPEED